MKKYLLTILALFSVTAMANDDFKASVTVGYGEQMTLYIKVESIIVYQHL